MVAPPVQTGLGREATRGPTPPPATTAPPGRINQNEVGHVRPDHAHHPANTHPEEAADWPYITAIPLALFIGIGIGGQGAAPAVAPAAAPATTVTVTAPADGRNDGGSLPAVPAPTYAPTGPLSTFSEGTYEVGTGDGQVAPGKYKSPGPGSYVLLKNNDGQLGDIIDIQISDGQLLLTVPKTAGYVEVRRCTFTKI
jgi:hypothetical protein